MGFENSSAVNKIARPNQNNVDQCPIQTAVNQEDLSLSFPTLKGGEFLFPKACRSGVPRTAEVMWNAVFRLTGGVPDQPGPNTLCW